MKIICDVECNICRTKIRIDCDVNDEEEDTNHNELPNCPKCGNHSSFYFTWVLPLDENGAACDEYPIVYNRWSPDIGYNNYISDVTIEWDGTWLQIYISLQDRVRYTKCDVISLDDLKSCISSLGRTIGFRPDTDITRIVNELESRKYIKKKSDGLVEVIPGRY